MIAPTATELLLLRNECEELRKQAALYAKDVQTVMAQRDKWKGCALVLGKAMESVCGFCEANCIGDVSLMRQALKVLGEAKDQ